MTVTLHKPEAAPVLPSNPHDALNFLRNTEQAEADEFLAALGNTDSADRVTLRALLAGKDDDAALQILHLRNVFPLNQTRYDGSPYGEVAIVFNHVTKSGTSYLSVIGYENGQVSNFSREVAAATGLTHKFHNDHGSVIVLRGCNYSRTYAIASALSEALYGNDHALADHRL